MQVHKSQLSPTRVKLTMVADTALLDSSRHDVLERLRREVKLPGFRQGKVPLELVEKNVSPEVLQSDFLDVALNRMYAEALSRENVRPVAQPQVSLTKFVPFTTLEAEAEVEAVGEVKLADYKKIRLARGSVNVSDKDVDEVVEGLRRRMAGRKAVTRAAKNGDEVVIDFAGRDTKTGEAIQGGAGKGYPLLLGSNTFIPGFEANLIGMKPGEAREFSLDFPKDYGVKPLQGRNVTFNVTVDKVEELELPVADDAFAAKAGPFKSLAELKADITRQVQNERQYQADRDYESDLLARITEKSEVAVPDALIDEELARLEREERQNVVYRGQTWEEHLSAEGVTEAEHRERNRPNAELRVRAGLVLAEIAQKERIEVTAEELDMYTKLQKGQYPDPKMQAELDKPENRRELASRLLSEKTIGRLVGYAAENAAAAEKPKKPATSTKKQ